MAIVVKGVCSNCGVAIDDHQTGRRPDGKGGLVDYWICPEKRKVKA